MKWERYEGQKLNDGDLIHCTRGGVARIEGEHINGKSWSAELSSIDSATGQMKDIVCKVFDEIDKFLTVVPPPKTDVVEVGMYAVNDPNYPQVKVGSLTICRQNNISVWIQHDSGEGAQFSDESFGDCLQKFYRDNF